VSFCLLRAAFAHRASLAPWACASPPSKARCSPRSRAFALPFRHCVRRDAATTVATLTLPAEERAQRQPSRRSERYGPVRRRVLARPRCTPGTRLSCRAWPGELSAWRWMRCARLTRLLQKSCPVLLCS